MANLSFQGFSMSSYLAERNAEVRCPYGYFDCIDLLHRATESERMRECDVAENRSASNKTSEIVLPSAIFSTASLIEKAWNGADDILADRFQQKIRETRRGPPHKLVPRA